MVARGGRLVWLGENCGIRCCGREERGDAGVKMARGELVLWETWAVTPIRLGTIDL
jgi:hypothetical protein